MDHAMLMGIVYCLTDDGEQMHDVYHWRNLPLTQRVRDVIGQGSPFDILHDHVADGLLRLRRASEVEIVDLHDVGMVQGSHYPCFTEKSCAEVGIVLQIKVQNLDSDVPLKLGVPSLPDLSHAPASQALVQFVFTQASWSCTSTHHGPSFSEILWSIYLHTYVG